MSAIYFYILYSRKGKLRIYCNYNVLSKMAKIGNGNLKCKATTRGLFGDTNKFGDKYTCSRNAGHTGPHIAMSGEEAEDVCALWPQK